MPYHSVRLLVNRSNFEFDSIPFVLYATKKWFGFDSSSRKTYMYVYKRNIRIMALLGLLDLRFSEIFTWIHKLAIHKMKYFDEKTFQFITVIRVFQFFLTRFHITIWFGSIFTLFYSVFLNVSKQHTPQETSSERDVKSNGNNNKITSLARIVRQWKRNI